MTEEVNILLILKDENCTEKVIDFLQNSIYIFEFHQEQSTAHRLTTTKYGKPFESSTVIKGGENEKYLRVYFLLKPLDTIKSCRRSITRGMFHYDAVIVDLNDEMDTLLILDYVKSLKLSDCLKPWHNVTIIGKIIPDIVQTINDSKYKISRWRRNNIFAYNLCTYRLDKKNNLWNHITKGNYSSTKSSCCSENALILNIIVFEFMHSLFSTMYFNINDINHLIFGITGGIEAHNSFKLSTLTCEGDLYVLQDKPAKDLLVQLDLFSLSDFNKLLKEEIKQLAHLLSPLIIFCGEIVHFTCDLHRQLFLRFRNLAELKYIDFNEVQKFNTDNIAEVVFHSIDAMSEMKYTGKYIKDVLGIEKLHELKSVLKKHYSFRNKKIDSLALSLQQLDLYSEPTVQRSAAASHAKFEKDIQHRRFAADHYQKSSCTGRGLNIPKSVRDDSFGNEAKQDSQLEKGNKTIHIEDRIGNIQLLNSLQKTLQEFKEELKDIRQLHEHNAKVMTKDIREIKEKLNICNSNDLSQKHDEGGFRVNE